MPLLAFPCQRWDNTPLPCLIRWTVFAKECRFSKACMPLYCLPFSDMYLETPHAGLQRCLSACKGVFCCFGPRKYGEWLDSGWMFCQCQKDQKPQEEENRLQVQLFSWWFLSDLRLNLDQESMEGVESEKTLKKDCEIVQRPTDWFALNNIFSTLAGIVEVWVRILASLI